MRLLNIGLSLLWALALTAQAELKFPELSGRVVDTANLIEPAVRQQLWLRLAWRVLHTPSHPQIEGLNNTIPQGRA